MPPAVPPIRPAIAFAGCEGGGEARAVQDYWGGDAESDGEIVDVAGSGDLETSPANRSRKTVVPDSKGCIRGRTHPHGRSRANAGLMPSG